MAEILPFKGIRYSRRKIENLWAVLSPPWDKLDERKAAKYRRAAPENVAHILVPNPEDDQMPWPSSANFRFGQWLSQGILRQDEAPVFYAYRQRFEHEDSSCERLGFLALSRLGPPEVSGVHPHENVFPDHYQSRLELLRETQANFGPVYMIYSDPEGQTARLLDSAEEALVIRAKDPELDIVHEFWPLKDPCTCSQLTSIMEHKDLIIADGHHRFGSAFEYATEWHAQHPDAPTPTEVDYRLVYLTPMENEGVIILPTHRVLKQAASKLPPLDSPTFKEFFELLGDSFDNEKELLLSMQARRSEEPKRKVLGLFNGEKFMMLRWTGKFPESYSTTHLHRSDVWKSLDVNVLHEIFLPYVLNWNKAADSHWVSHHREPQQAAEKVRSTADSLGVFLSKTSRLEVQAIALAGEKMPQKSTDFYPKIPTGLVFRKMNL